CKTNIYIDPKINASGSSHIPVTTGAAISMINVAPKIMAAPKVIANVKVNIITQVRTLVEQVVTFMPFINTAVILYAVFVANSPPIECVDKSIVTVPVNKDLKFCEITVAEDLVQEFWETRGKFKYADALLQKQLIPKDSTEKSTDIITFCVATIKKPLVLKPLQHDQSSLVVKMVVAIPGVIVGIGVGTEVIIGPIVPVLVGTGLGIKLLIELIKEKVKEKAIKNGGGGNGGNNNQDPEKDPKDDKDKKSLKEFPNGKYEDNPKHHQNSKGNISKPPRNGQKALDESIEVPGKDYRVGIEDGKIIQFNQHSPNKYHGYIIEDYNDLHPAAQKALYKAGFITNAKTGRIAK
ncbi:MAG TPA: hypothetical protein VLG50_06085, partial [Candidatus Saccharimonadales bacterium]|nr:hypothetical protein [Candidatus Saccharimonadales bacterium]